jgi:Site-specific recombinase XerD
MAIGSLYEILMVSPLVEEGYIINNPCSKIRGVAKPKKKEKKSLTDEDFNAMLESCKNIRDCAILTMLRYTGIRSNELRSIKYEDYINYDANKGLTLKVTKGSKERTIFLNDRVIKEINAYLPYRKEGCDCLFTSNTGTKILETSLLRTIKCIGKRANLDEDVLDNLSPHSFRHTAISSWLNSGVPIQTVATIVGHSNVNMTFYYADKRMMNAKEAMMSM